jgi:hypothetical protein
VAPPDICVGGHPWFQVHADAIVDGTEHSTLRAETGGHNVGELTAGQVEIWARCAFGLSQAVMLPGRGF